MWQPLFFTTQIYIYIYVSRADTHTHTTHQSFGFSWSMLRLSRSATATAWKIISKLFEFFCSGNWFELSTDILCWGRQDLKYSDLRSFKHIARVALISTIRSAIPKHSMNYVLLRYRFGRSMDCLGTQRPLAFIWARRRYGIRKGIELLNKVLLGNSQKWCCVHLPLRITVSGRAAITYLFRSFWIT